MQNVEQILESAKRLIIAAYPEVLAIYVFGSVATNNASSNSYLDLAVLLPGLTDKYELWKVAQDVAIAVDRDIDLIDLRDASTVLAFQIIQNGTRILCRDFNQVAAFENFSISEYLNFQERKSSLLQDVKKLGGISDDVVINKIAIIERCLQRIEQEYVNHEAELESNFSKQDSIILNLERACEAAIDLGLHIIRVKRLEIPQTTREIFVILEHHGVISKELSKNLQAMVGFRNIAIHDYQKINLDVVRGIIKERLADFIVFNKAVICKMS